MKAITIFSILLFLNCNIEAQNCNTYFAMNEGVKQTYEFYNGKNKVVSRTTNYFKDVSSSGSNVTATLVTEMIDVKKDAVLSTSQTRWRCENGVVHFNMNAMNVEGIDLSNTAVDVTVDGDEMEIPSTLEPGQTLKDVNYHIVMKMGGITMMDRNFFVKNRKIEGKETVTTPAGTFEAVKVSYTTENAGKSGNTSKPMPTTIWYAASVGVLKMENYKDGKVYSSQMLTKLER